MVVFIVDGGVLQDSKDVIVTPGWRQIGNSQDQYMNSGEDTWGRTESIVVGNVEKVILRLLHLTICEVLYFLAAERGRG